MQLNAFSRRSIIGNDPAKIRDWAQAAEDLGYAYIEVSDHVGACVIRAPLRMFDVRCPTDADLSMLGIAVVTFQCSSKQRLCWKALAADAGGKPYAFRQRSVRRRHGGGNRPCWGLKDEQSEALHSPSARLRQPRRPPRR
jgi:hypothetical protein